MKHFTIIFTICLLFVACQTPVQAQFYQPTEETKGTIHAVEYYSTTLNETRRMQIYLPFEYEIKKLSPTLSFIYSMEEGTMKPDGKKGNVKAILDEKIASCEALPMIVVMPNGQLPVHLYKDELINDIIPYIEKSTGLEPIKITGPWPGYPWVAFKSWMLDYATPDCLPI
ncbi:MAG: hypothetical protein LIP05_05265 [Tannerellaceae bacterium]|nr:hypothetical protein [Tannerellaceae bacterium]